MTAINDLLACPRCDKTPLEVRKSAVYCKACKVEFPSVADIPWLFAEPDASLAEWRNRLAFALQTLDREIAAIDTELNDAATAELTRARTSRYREALADHRGKLAELLQPVGLHGSAGTYESYLALRTRLPTDQGLNTYYPNIHRDWCWGKDENDASLRQIRDVLGQETDTGTTLVLGAGAGRLAYDIHIGLAADLTVAFDFNPLLMLVAQQMAAGSSLELYEFPIAPKESDDDAVLRTLSAPAAAGDGFVTVLGDALRPPFAAGVFDTVVTPWLIDIISEDLPVFAARINGLLKPGGRWINFGSLSFATAQRSRRYARDEVCAIVASQGFAAPIVAEATIPYMNSPASRHGRLETTCSFAAAKIATADPAPRHRALPDWIVTGKEAVPPHPSFRTQAMTTQVYAFVMTLIDGRRSIEDMALIFEQKQLMPRAEAIPAIRGFLIKMYDDAVRQDTFQAH